MPAGSYDLEVTLADGGDVAISAPGTVLEANSTYVLVIMGQPNDTDHPLEIRALSDTTEARDARRQRLTRLRRDRPPSIRAVGRHSVPSPINEGVGSPRVRGTYVPLTRGLVARRRAMSYRHLDPGASDPNAARVQPGWRSRTRPERDREVAYVQIGDPGARHRPGDGSAPGAARARDGRDC